MLWWKAIHIIGVISWMAGLLYLYRLFVYHNQEIEGVVKGRFERMEKRLFSIITTPAFFLTLLSGIVLIGYNVSYYLKQGWLHTKLLLVFFLVILHFLNPLIAKKLKTKNQPYNNVSLRILNEIPTLLMILIVFLVVLKP